MIEKSQLSSESKEEFKYKLNLVIHRHGPKQGEAGPLSDEGKELSREVFEDAYENIVMDSASGGIDVEYSPIHRAQQTAEIYTGAIQRMGSGKVKSESVDERLSEGGIAENKEVLGKLLEEYGKGGKWIEGWLKMETRPAPEIKTGKEAVADFSSWVLDKIKNIQERGGYQEVDAFSHGPVMTVFLIKLQEKLSINILPENWQDKKIFENVLNYLSSMNMWTDSSTPEVINLSFSGQKVEVPLTLLQELKEKN